LSWQRRFKAHRLHTQNNLARLLGRRADRIHLAPFEQGEIGSDLFRAAREMGLEGLASKHKDRPYRIGPSDALDQSEPSVAGDGPGIGDIARRQGTFSSKRAGDAEQKSSHFA
jgi:hypothetical protein